MERQRMYIAIDLKSFYASVECVERGLDPLTTNLVVADASRTEKTICLAVSPSLKAYGISGRARLFEVVQRVKEVNAERRAKLHGRDFAGSSCQAETLQMDDSLEVSYIAAPPRMAEYMKVSTRIYQIYLKYVAPEDMHVYSVDEVFIDVTDYLDTYQKTAHELAMTMIKDVLDMTGITATAGIGTNLYLAKIAMDIVAKHMPADENGVRIAELDEQSYRRILWTHEPITDFWRVGHGYAKRLHAQGLYTMGDVARCSIGKETDYYNEDLLYKMFGVNAELLIDHAWGWEPCTIPQIKAYRPSNNSVSSGQVLQQPYDYEKTKIIVREMTESLVLDLVSKSLVTDQVVLTIGYDIENLTDPDRAKAYRGPVKVDHYGRKVPKHAHGTGNLDGYTSSTQHIMDVMMRLFDRIVNPTLLTRRITVVANHVVPESSVEKATATQMDLFSDYHLELEEPDSAEVSQQKKLSFGGKDLSSGTTESNSDFQSMLEETENVRRKERKLQEAMLSIQKKYGKNAILKGTNLKEGATTMERNKQIGGHKA